MNLLKEPPEKKEKLNYQGYLKYVFHGVIIFLVWKNCNVNVFMDKSNIDNRESRSTFSNLHSLTS